MKQPETSEFIGTVCYDRGSDPALDIRVLVRRGRHFWHAVLDDFSLHPRGSGQLPSGSRGYVARYCDRAGIDEMPVPTEFKAPTDGGAVMISWRSPDGFTLAWARLFELRGDWTPVGPAWSSPEPREH